MERGHDGVPSKLDECSLGGAAGTESRPMLFSHRDNLSAASWNSNGRKWVYLANREVEVGGLVVFQGRQNLAARAGA